MTTTECNCCGDALDWMGYTDQAWGDVCRDCKQSLAIAERVLLKEGIENLYLAQCPDNEGWAK